MEAVGYVEVQSACVHGHNLPERAAVYGGRGLARVHKRVEFPGGGAVQEIEWYKAQLTVV